MQSLTLVVLKKNNLQRLIRKINFLEKIYDSLNVEYKKYFSVLVCENSTKDDGTIEFLRKSIKKIEWLSYYSQDEHVSFDQNALNGYLEAQSDYIWFLGLDDEICYAEEMMKIMDLINHYRPVGITMSSKPSCQRDITFSDRHIQIIYDREEQLKNIIGHGKVSCNILKREEINQRLEIDEMIGKGYMHLSLQAFNLLRKNKAPFININFPVIKTDQSFGDKNKHTLNAATLIHETVAYREFISNHPKMFSCLKVPNYRRLRFLIYAARTSTEKCWKTEYFYDFLSEIFADFHNQKNLRQIVLIFILFLIWLFQGKIGYLSFSLRRIFRK